MKWELKSFDEIGFIGRGKSRHRPRNAEHLYGGEYPFVQTGDIKAAGFRIKDYTQTYNEAGLAQSKLWTEGTLCITIAANIADTAILGIDACFPDSVIGFVPYEDKSDVRFVKYFFDIFQARMKSIAVGAAQDNLSLEKLLTFKIPTPPLPIQRRIASILSAYDDLIENNLKRIKLLEEKAFLRYKQMEREEKLKRKSILDICYITDGTHDSPKQQVDGLYLVTGKHLIGGFIDFSSAYFISETDHDKIQKRSKVVNGDLILSNIGTIGNVAIIDSPFEFSVKNVIIFKPNDSIYTSFLYCYLNSIEMQTRFQQESSGTSQRFISLAYTRALNVKLPSEDVLKEFHKEVSSFLKLKSILNHQNTKLRSARDILLPKLMSGQIDV